MSSDFEVYSFLDLGFHFDFQISIMVFFYALAQTYDQFGGVDFVFMDI